MKTLIIIAGNYGNAFFIEDKLIQYIHENDGQWRDEYFNPILEALDVKVVRTIDATSIQLEQIKQLEQ